MRHYLKIAAKDILEYRKKFKNKDIQFAIVFISDNIDKLDVKLFNLRKNLGIPITVLNKQDVNRYYNVPECTCDYSILLDKVNSVRFAHFDVHPVLMSSIIKKELLKDKPSIR